MTAKKALEVLKSWLQLAYQNADGTDECCAELYEALQTVFALITRQKTENENLKVENQSLRSAANSLKMHYEEAQAEIERLKKKVEELSEVLSDSIRIRYKEVQSEAVKEFVERLKEVSSKMTMCDNGTPISTSYQISSEELDSILKEMVGENNE